MDHLRHRATGLRMPFVVRQLQVGHHRPVPVRPPRFPQVHAYTKSRDRAPCRATRHKSCAYTISPITDHSKPLTRQNVLAKPQICLRTAEVRSVHNQERREPVMDLLHDRCAGLDVSKKDVKACVRSPGARANQRHSEVRTFATTTNALLQLRDWLIEQRVTLIAIEATGDYWRPPFYLLEDDLNIILVNPAHAKGLPGRKSDVTDSMWLAQLGECGLLKASFVPPTPIRQLRDLTRYRTTLSREHTREAARLEKELEDAGIKISSVATDILGVSGRAMLEALIAGERDPQVLAQMARGRMRTKISPLT